MCGSTDLIKENGVFVCQSCGCKYSVEEAKKMMVEGTVEVKGTVKIDESDKVRNLIILANRARDEDNAAEAKKYYELILLEDPDNWEANYYASYYALMEGSIAQLPDNLRNFRKRANSALKILLSDQNGLSEADDFFKQTSYVYRVVSSHVNKRQQEIVQEIINTTMSMLTSGFNSQRLDNATEKGQKEQAELFRMMGHIQDSIIDIIGIVEEYKFPKDNKEFQNLLITCDNAYAIEVKKIIEVKDYENYIQKLLNYVDVLKRIMPEYKSNGLSALKKQASVIASGSGINVETGKKMLSIIERWEQKEKQTRKDKYWEEHKEEKEQYLARLTEISSEINSLTEKIAGYEKIEKAAYKQFLDDKEALNKEAKVLKDQINDLEGRIRKLGLFSRKEKQSLQSQIDTLSQRLSDLEKANREKDAVIKAEYDIRNNEIKDTVAPIKKKLNALQGEKRSIEDELNKDR